MDFIENTTFLAEQHSAQDYLGRLDGRYAGRMLDLALQILHKTIWDRNRLKLSMKCEWALRPRYILFMVYSTSVACRWKNPLTITWLVINQTIVNHILQVSNPMFKLWSYDSGGLVLTIKRHKGRQKANVQLLATSLSGEKSQKWYVYLPGWFNKPNDRSLRQKVYTIKFKAYGFLWIFIYELHPCLIKTR